MPVASASKEWRAAARLNEFEFHLPVYVSKNVSMVQRKAFYPYISIRLGGHPFRQMLLIFLCFRENWRLNPASYPYH